MARTIKILFNSLSSLSLKKLWRLTKLVARHPWFALFSFHATAKSFALARKHYPNTHSTNGKGNAFRHALWCCLILMYCCKISSPKKALKWTKEMTDMHEELFPNEPLETKMDLHNNQIGMDLFMEMLPGIHRQFFESSFFVEKLKILTKNAEILTDVDQNLGQALVYLSK